MFKADSLRACIERLDEELHKSFKFTNHLVL